MVNYWNFKTKKTKTNIKCQKFEQMIEEWKLNHNSPFPNENLQHSGKLSMN